MAGTTEAREIGRAPVGELAELSARVDRLELHADRDEIAEAFSIRDRLDARIAAAVAELEAAGAHEDDGAVSMAGWLRQEAGRDACTAARTATASRKLARLPGVSDAYRDGLLSGGQVEIILANVPGRHLARFAEHEADLIGRLVGLSIDDTRVVMQAWKQRADALDPPRPPVEHDNQLYLSRTLDARGELRGSFDADETAVIDAALRTADPKDFDLPMPERRAVALTQVCQFFLDHQQQRRGGRHRPHLNVVVPFDGLATGEGGRYLDTGQPVSPDALGVLACDSAYHRLLVSAASGILDYGRATRAWPVDLYNAILLRDGGCRFGDCDAPPAWCDVHHEPAWEDGGVTSLGTGVMGCRRHHRMAHKPGYSVKILPDGTVEFTHPSGRVQVSHPRGPLPPPHLLPVPDTS